MISVEVHISEWLLDLPRRIGMKDQYTEELVREVGNEGVRVMREEINKRAKTPARTGGLRETIHWVKEGTGCKIVADAPHAMVVNVGAKRHYIKPRDAKALLFKVGGVNFLRKLVDHPGFKGLWYGARTAYFMPDIAVKKTLEFIDKWLNL